MVKTSRHCLGIAGCIVIFGTMAFAQGLAGAPSCIRHLSQTPPLLRGATDDQRWGLFLKSQQLLIGMKRSDVINLFGAGAPYAMKNELTFSLTDEKTPAKKGQVAYLELTLKFRQDTVSGYTVEAVYWG
jgi:hypothetical protein